MAFVGRSPIAKQCAGLGSGMRLHLARAVDVLAQKVLIVRIVDVVVDVVVRVVVVVFDEVGQIADGVVPAVDARPSLPRRTGVCRLALVPIGVLALLGREERACTDRVERGVVGLSVEALRAGPTFPALSRVIVCVRSPFR